MLHMENVPERNCKADNYKSNESKHKSKLGNAGDDSTLNIAAQSHDRTRNKVHSQQASTDHGRPLPPILLITPFTHRASCKKKRTYNQGDTPPGEGGTISATGINSPS